MGVIRKEGYERISHPFLPVYDRNAKILILGSLPSRKSREEGFYYGNPRNRFWQVISRILDEEMPLTKAGKRDLLLKNKIALWDVIACCDIIGSDDTSIKNVIAADIGKLLKETEICKIFTNGGKAKALYDQWIYPSLGMEAERLPSTSPANAAYSLEKLYASWKTIKESLGK
ncbi:MAG: DNA-deoxyinosine glycosylase [Johnsonella sp.]|nr:DNA-deoxyinosine glycosylase [Johnsonella sp.]